ncbi:MAG: hypothetical protein ACXWKP_32545 [Bradyrhizobium sp.]
MKVLTASDEAAWPVQQNPGVAALAVGLRSQLSHYVAPSHVDFTLRLSSCRFHDASTSEISGQNLASKKPLKLIEFQWLDDWLRGQDLNL